MHMFWCGPRSSGSSCNRRRMTDSQASEVQVFAFLLLPFLRQRNSNKTLERCRSFRATSRVARSVTATTRLYSTETGTKSSNLPLYLVGAGLAAAGAYGYTTFGKVESEKPKKVLTSALDPQKFVDVKLKRVEPYNHNTSVFVFELPEGQASLLPIASCVFLKAEDLKDANGKPMARPYTPISPSDLEGELSFIIKRYETGNVSKYIHSLSPGDTLAVKGPSPKWPWKSDYF
ncbi:hypothetical protein EDD16DRAFT_338937 [Pisolithus croceorrhizus]|nr:hypothetical protein EDD16DRAFT_338937 [Pisolithus croceorrhizus]